MVTKIPKVSRIAEIPQIYRTKSKKIKKMKSPKVSPEQVLEDKQKTIGNLLLARLYFLQKGNYKQYSQAKIKYAEYAVENYEAVKTMPKEKIPNMSMPLFSPLLPFYAIRIARILIMDLFRKKTPAEIKLAKLAKENLAGKL